jgi:hypothetical protein
MKFVKALVLLFLFFPIGVGAVGVSVSPSSLEVLYPDKQDLELVIQNISLEPVSVYIYPDDYKKSIVASPDEIKLLPDEFGRISLSLDFSGEESGVKNTQISVVTKAIDKRSFNAASGLKIPISINIHQESWRWSAAAVFVVAFGSLFILAIIVQLIFILSRPRKKKHWYNLNFLSHHKKRNIFGK